MINFLVKKDNRSKWIFEEISRRRFRSLIYSGRKWAIQIRERDLEVASDGSRRKKGLKSRKISTDGSKN